MQNNTPSSPPSDEAVGKTGWFRGWKRWVVIGAAAAALIVLVVALPDDDPDGTSVAIDNQNDDSAAEEATSTTTEASEEATSTTTEAFELKDGTRDNPLDFGVAWNIIWGARGDADVSVWNITIGAPQDITTAVLDHDSYGDPPPDGVVFAGFTVDMALVEANKEPLSVGFNFTWELIGAATSTVYDNSSFDFFGCGGILGGLADEFDASKEVFAGGTLTGTVCIPLPVEELADPGLQVAMKLRDGDPVFFGQ